MHASDAQPDAKKYGKVLGEYILCAHQISHFVVVVVVVHFRRRRLFLARSWPAQSPLHGFTATTSSKFSTVMRRSHLLGARIDAVSVEGQHGHPSRIHRLRAPALQRSCPPTTRNHLPIAAAKPVGEVPRVAAPGTWSSSPTSSVVPANDVAKASSAHRSLISPGSLMLRLGRNALEAESFPHFGRCGEPGCRQFTPTNEQAAWCHSTLTFRSRCRL